MKKTIAVTLLLVSLGLLKAQITIDAPGYGVSDYFDTPVSGDTIVSYDWNDSNLYYQAVSPDYSFDGLYENAGATPVVSGTSDYPGASVVSIGNYVYYNTSDNSNEKIYAYNATTGTSSLVSTATNYGLYKNSGSLYITGAPGFGTNHIYQTGVNANGTLTLNPPQDLGADSGSSGPLAFDAQGNLYYAPGFGDQSIYEWSAAEIAAAIANPTADPLSATGHLWASYASQYADQAGGTSMIVDGNQLILSLTNFSGPSDLVSFGISSTGTETGATTILDSQDTLGELRMNDGNLYLSNDGSIYEITVPEPSTYALLTAGLLVLVVSLRGKRVRAGAVVVALVAIGSLTSRAQEGPFSPAYGYDAIAANDPNIVGWATGVVSANPGPVQITTPNGAKASYGTPSNALGPSDATVDNPTPVYSLGDGGSITLSFSTPIANGPGYDLAVYENGFALAGSSTQFFLELATVSVSSNGVNFFTFPSVSLTQTATQVGAFGTLDPTYLYNLAGSQPVGYGTAFNLSDLAADAGPLLNLNDITEVRITDVIGNINMSLGAGTYTYDDETNPIFNGAYGTTNHLINDPYPTAFTSGGFDLDAVAVLNTTVAPEPSTYCLLLSLFVPAFFLRKVRRFSN